MFKQRQHLISLPGLLLAGSLVVVAGCGGSDGSAGNAAGASGGDSPASVTATAPAAPASLTATAGNATVSLQWAASTNATSYNVKRATASGGPYAQLASSTSTTYTDSSAVNGTAYFYVVSALDTAGESANSAQAAATPTGTTTPPPTTGGTAAIPATPANLAATPGNVLVALTWTASSNATSYHVKRSSTSGGPYVQVGAPTSASYSDTSVNNGTTYYYVVSALDAAGESANSAQVVALPDPPTSTSSLSPTGSGCGMQLGNTPVVFCETFDTPAGVAGTRTGDLNPNVWGVSRTIGDGVNFGQGQLNQWNATTIQKCDGTTPTVVAPNDIIICNGQLREASNDNNTLQFEDGTVTNLAIYPKQPFDFAGRTGTVSFDVSNDTGGIHSAWPEFWMTDAPVPGPFSHFGSWQSLPANGFGIRFSTESPVGMQGLCPNANNLNQLRWTIDSAVVVRGYVLDDSEGYGTRSAMNVTLLDCVIEPSGPGQFNHVELRIAQNQIDVYATDAGVAATPTTLRHIAVVTNANLTLSRGLIWIEDAHYNADKGLDSARPTQRQHTFSWDNVAFDGPFTDRDFAYDAPDNNAPGPNGSLNLGQLAQPNGTTTWNIRNLPANREAAAAKVLFNFTGGGGANPTVLNVTVNGNTTTVPWPYPDQLAGTWRTFVVQVPLTDVVTGTNVVQLGADTAQLFSNVDLVLGDVTGGVPVLPGANDAYPD